MAGLHVAFNAYMQSVIEMSNNGSTPFVLTYKVGQEKIIFLVIAGSVVFVLIYYYIKLLIKFCRKGYKIGQSQNFNNKVAKFVRLTYQQLAASKEFTVNRCYGS